MALITETVTVVSVSTDPPNQIGMGMAMAQPVSTPAAPAVGSITLRFSDGFTITRAVPVADIQSLAPLVGTQQPLALG